jgi:predicted nucleic acid-binding protein
MSEPHTPRIGPHDLGGLPGGAVDRDEHEAAYWERRVDAMVRLLFDKEILVDAAQLRAGIESLGPDVYERLGYYERWAASTARHAVDIGLVTQAELEARIARLRGSEPESAR